MEGGRVAGDGEREGSRQWREGGQQAMERGRVAGDGGREGSRRWREGG